MIQIRMFLCGYLKPWTGPAFGVGGSRKPQWEEDILAVTFSSIPKVLLPRLMQDETEQSMAKKTVVMDLTRSKEMRRESNTVKNTGTRKGHFRAFTVRK